MKFGFGLLTGQMPPDDDKTYEEVYEEDIRLAQIAEESGFDSVWTSEHHFFNDGYSPSPLSICAALATATSEVQIGTCIALAPLYNPVRLAEDAATIDLLSGGRFVLGLGNGYISKEFEVLDVPREERGKRTTEAIEICKRAWTRDGFDFDGDVFSYSGLNVEPKPTTDGGPPILLGGTSKPAIRRAVRRADGHLGVVYYGEGWDETFSFEQFSQNVEFIGEQMDIEEEEFVLSFIQYANIGDSAETAWEELLPAFVYSRRKYTEHTAQRKETLEWDLDQLTDEQKAELQEGCLVGEPETVVEELRALEEQLPVELHYIARLNLPSFSFEKRAETVRRFGDEVIAEY